MNIKQIKESLSKLTFVELEMLYTLASEEKNNRTYLDNATPNEIDEPSIKSLIKNITTK